MPKYILDLTEEDYQRLRENVLKIDRFDGDQIIRSRFDADPEILEEAAAEDEGSTGGKKGK